MKTRSTTLTLGCVLALLLAVPASAGVTTYVYNFDRGDEGWVDGTGPVGYDNWAGSNGLIQMKDAGTIANMSGWTMWSSCVSPYTNIGTVTRLNDANFSFSIPADAIGLELQYSAQGAWTGSGRYTRRLFGLGNAGNYRVRFGDSSSTTSTPHYYINTNNSNVGITNAQRENKLVVDFTANSGAGSATAYYDDYGGSGWQLISAAWQNINLGLTPGEWASWNNLYLVMNSYTRIDNLAIRVITPSNDLTIKKFFDCNLDDTKNGEDIYLSGWQFNVSNVAYGGTYNETHTTDVNGEINLIGLAAAGDYDVTETVKGTGWVLSGANPRTVSVSSSTTVVGFGNQLPGDANQDEKVNLADFTILKAHFGEDPAGWTFGNFNADTTVNLADFTILKAHFGEGAPSAGGVPEPATMGLVALGALALLRRRRR